MFLFVFQNLLHTVRHLAREEGTKHMGQFLSVGCSRCLNIQAVMCLCPCNMAQCIYSVSMSSGEVARKLCAGVRKGIQGGTVEGGFILWVYILITC